MPLLFSYGSNGTAQLRGRLSREDLTARPACAKGYVLIFFKDSRWGGGVASLFKDPSEKGQCLGSVTEVSESELEVMDRFEGGYSRQVIKVSVGPQNEAEEAEAVAYIASKPKWEEEPSEAYLTAIFVHLREHWGRSCLPITVRKVDLTEGVAVCVKEWVPPATVDLSLEAFCVEINALKTKPWVMPATITEVTGKLSCVGVRSVRDLAKWLDQDNVTALLEKDGQSSFHTETLGIMKKLLKFP